MIAVSFPCSHALFFNGLLNRLKHVMSRPQSPQHQNDLQSIGSEVHRRCACDDAVMSLDSNGYVSRIILPSEIKLQPDFNLAHEDDLITALKNPATRNKFSKGVMQILSYMLKERARYGFIITNNMVIAFKRCGNCLKVYVHVQAQS